MARETMEFDVVCVGAGVASLSTVLRLLKRVRAEGGGEPAPSVLVIEKGAAVGNHVLSGAVLDPAPLADLLTEPERKAFPVETNVAADAFYRLTAGGAMKLPWTPAMMRAEGFPIVSLSSVTRYLAKLCEGVGAEIYSEFSAAQLIEEGGRVAGIRIGDKGLNKDGSKKHAYEEGPDIRAKVVVLGEGACGRLTEKLIADRQLNAGRNSQTYALGVKELIDIPERPAQAGRVIHTFGYPNDDGTYGGGFLYGLSPTRVAIGMVTALDYTNPTVNPHENFRLFKLHPLVRPFIEGGKAIGYGAKVLPEGGCHSVPELVVDGALIVGDGAGLLDSLRIKGAHIAMQSGIAAGDALFACWRKRDYGRAGLQEYPRRFLAMSGWTQMKRVRNVRAAFTHGTLPGLMAAGLSWATGGALPPGRLAIHEDWKGLKPKARVQPRPQVPKPDAATENIQLDRLTDVFHSGTTHDEHQPCHLRIPDPAKCVECIGTYGAPCTLFCPAQVYALNDDGKSIRIDFTNCLHCKTCQIKDPFRNIEWTLPEGGGGPRYKAM